MKKSQLLLCIAAVYIIWGSTFLGIRIGLETLPPFLLGAIRFISAALLMKILFWKKLKNANKPPLWWRVFSGFLLFTVGNGAVVVAEERLPSGIAALTCATLPVITVLMSYLFGQAEKFTIKIGMACVLGTIGVWLLTLNDNNNYKIFDVLIILVGSLAWAAASLGSRKYKGTHSLITMVDDQMLWGGIFFLVIAIFRGEISHVDIHAVSAKSLYAVAYLSVAGSVIAFSAYMWLIANTSHVVATSYAYVNPIIAIALGVLLGGEKIGVEVLWAAFFIIVSVILILYAPKKNL